MERVFLNLISNALDAMPDGGRIRITAETEGSQVFIRIEDTGVVTENGWTLALMARLASLCWLDSNPHRSITDLKTCR